jgi:hypothetical protein
MLMRRIVLRREMAALIYTEKWLGNQPSVLENPRLVIAG